MDNSLHIVLLAPSTFRLFTHSRTHTRLFLLLSFEFIKCVLKSLINNSHTTFALGLSTIVPNETGEKQISTCLVWTADGRELQGEITQSWRMRRWSSVLARFTTITAARRDLYRMWTSGRGSGGRILPQKIESWSLRHDGVNTTAPVVKIEAHSLDIVRHVDL